MTENLRRVITEFGDNFSIQDISILKKGITYYFTLSKDKNIYKGKFTTFYDNKIEKRFVIDDVEIYNGYCFQRYTNTISTPFIDKIYYI